MRRHSYSSLLVVRDEFHFRPNFPNVLGYDGHFCMYPSIYLGNMWYSLVNYPTYNDVDKSRSHSSFRMKTPYNNLYSVLWSANSRRTHNDDNALRLILCTLLCADPIMDLLTLPLSHSLPMCDNNLSSYPTNKFIRNSRNYPNINFIPISLCNP